MLETIVCELTVALGSGPRWSSTRVIEVEATDVIRRFTIAAGATDEKVEVQPRSTAPPTSLFSSNSATDEAGVTIVVGRDATP